MVRGRCDGEDEERLETGSSDVGGLMSGDSGNQLTKKELLSKSR